MCTLLRCWECISWDLEQPMTRQNWLNSFSTPCSTPGPSSLQLFWWHWSLVVWFGCWWVNLNIQIPMTIFYPKITYRSYFRQRNQILCWHMTPMIIIYTLYKTIVFPLRSYGWSDESRKQYNIYLNMIYSCYENLNDRFCIKGISIRNLKKKQKK